MRFLGVTFLVAATLGLAACGGSSDDSSTDSEPAGGTGTTQQEASGGGSAAEGEQIFATNCSSCHTLAAAGAAGQVGPNLDQAMPSEATVKAMVTNGGSGMPSFSSSLDSAQIDAVAKYVSTSAGN